MELEEFENVVNKVIDNLPDKFKNILKKEKIEIISREKAPPAIRRKFQDNIVFGVFVGISRKDKSTFSFQTEPTRIEIYKESFEYVFGKTLSDKIKEEIAKTVIHEIGHYFGFNEEEIQRLVK